ncbi:MAG: ABC transporter substrate-binding protein [Magnetovibrio sp.]|nr:ABC transporter substrate-binding protein [Magnetovibrio sp.]
MFLSNNRLPLLAAVGILTMLLSGCIEKNPKDERASRAAEATGDILIGTVWPLTSAKKDLKNGVILAQEQINAAGGIMGRQVKIQFQDDQRNITKGIRIAYDFVSNPDMVAVIGHLDSYISLATASVYQFGGMLMVTPGSSATEITQQNFDLVFRTIPNNFDQGYQLATYAKDMGYKRVMLYYIKNAYGRDLANAFENAANKHGLQIIDRISYLKGASNYQRAMQYWADFYSFDAIFLAGSLPEGAEIIHQARKVGITQPFFSAAGLDANTLIENGGIDVEGTVVTSFFHPDMQLPESIAFTKRYEKRFGKRPDSAAAQGYDALMLLSHGMTVANSTVPADVAAALHQTKDWRGATGTHTVAPNGDMINKKIVKKLVRNGAFAYIP